MIALTDLLRRIPVAGRFALAALIQVVLIAAMVGDRVRVLRTGTEIKLQTRPVDPRDFLRGDYVTLAYDISSMPSGDLKDKQAPGRNATVYVKLAPKPDGFYGFVSVHAEPVPIAGDEVLIQGRTAYGANCGIGGRPVFCSPLSVQYGIERYFVPEGEGKVIEGARNQGKVAVIVAVTATGRAAIKRLLIDGNPVYDEPLF